MLQRDRGLRREADGDAGALPQLALQVDGGVVEERRMLDDGEPQARTPALGTSSTGLRIIPTRRSRTRLPSLIVAISPQGPGFIARIYVVFSLLQEGRQVERQANLPLSFFQLLRMQHVTCTDALAELCLELIKRCSPILLF